MPACWRRPSECRRRDSTTNKDADTEWPSSRYTWAGVGVQEGVLGDAGGAVVVVEVWVELGPGMRAGVSTGERVRVLAGGTQGWRAAQG